MSLELNSPVPCGMFPSELDRPACFLAMLFGSFPVAPLSQHTWKDLSQASFGNASDYIRRSDFGRHISTGATIMFQWDVANVAHIARHNVQPHEAEEVYESQPLDLDYSTEDGEERYIEIGETLSGRILLIVYTMRAELVRIVTAYDPDRSLRLTYLAFKESEQHGKEDHS